MESGLHEVMAMAEGMLFRFEKTGDRYAPPAFAMGGCSVKGRPAWFRICVRESEEGDECSCVDLYLRDYEGSPWWELRLGGDCRWSSKIFYGGRDIGDVEWEVDDAIGDAIRTRNAGLDK